MTAPDPLAEAPTKPLPNGGRPYMTDSLPLQPSWTQEATIASMKRIWKLTTGSVAVALTLASF
jgi:hypothetical protein